MTMTPERLEEIDGWSFPKGHVIRELLAEVRALQAKLAKAEAALELLREVAAEADSCTRTSKGYPNEYRSRKLDDLLARIREVIGE